MYTFLRQHVKKRWWNFSTSPNAISDFSVYFLKCISYSISAFITSSYSKVFLRNSFNHLSGSFSFQTTKLSQLHSYWHCHVQKVGQSFYGLCANVTERRKKKYTPLVAFASLKCCDASNDLDTTKHPVIELFKLITKKQQQQKTVCALCTVHDDKMCHVFYFSAVRQKFNNKSVKVFDMLKSEIGALHVL